MVIGIDISQTAYEGTGVSSSIKNLIQELIANDTNNQYILFFSSLRNNPPTFKLNPNVKIKRFRLSPSLLDLLWNRFHILPVEKLIGKVDVFISSDWTEPPSKGKKVTFIHDLVVYKFPEETDRLIVETQKRKLKWSVKECSAFLCPSLATKNDAIEILKIPENKISVVSWGN